MIAQGEVLMGGLAALAGPFFYAMFIFPIAYLYIGGMFLIKCILQRCSLVEREIP